MNVGFETIEIVIESACFAAAGRQIQSLEQPQNANSWWSCSKNSRLLVIKKNKTGRQ